MLVFLLLTSALKCTKAVIQGCQSCYTRLPKLLYKAAKAVIQGCLYFELAKGPRRVRDVRPVATRLNIHAHDVEIVSVVAK
jgi:hypothetical protein